MVEALHHIGLLLVNLLHLSGAVVLSDLDKVILCTIEKSNTDMSLLQGTDIVCSVTAHESSVASIFESE